MALAVIQACGKKSDGCLSSRPNLRLFYALATGAVARGQHYLVQYPGWGGKLLFLAATGAVFMAGAKMIEAIELNRIYSSDY